MENRDFGVAALLEKNPHPIPRMRNTKTNFRNLYKEY
jgi:hypothetical protein